MSEHVAVVAGTGRELDRAAAEKLANAALFLACDESSYVTGIDVVVDGGMKAW